MPQWLDSWPLHYNLFVFAPNGATIDCALDVPGSAHDSQVAHWGRCCHRLKDTHDETGGMCCVDSAFRSDNVIVSLLSSGLDSAKAETERDFDIMSQTAAIVWTSS